MLMLIDTFVYLALQSTLSPTVLASRIYCEQYLPAISVTIDVGLACQSPSIAA